MNHCLPYEELLAIFLESIPLPDENFAWAAMEQRLDDEVY